MQRSTGWAAAIAATLLPMIPMAFLYKQNADYLSGPQMMIAGAIMMALSLVAYFVFRWVFRSRLAGFMGCLTVWAIFFGFSGMYDVVVNAHRLMNGSRYIRLYAAAGAVLLIAVLFLFRKRESPKFCVFALFFVGLMLAMNLVPAVTTMLAVDAQERSVDLSKLKTEFAVDQATATPNVYWIHADGMLGFNAFKTYFGDDQAEFVDALKQRGFELNENAMLEANHATSVAVAALMCPSFYDTQMAPLLLSGDRVYSGLSKSEVRTARLYNEMIRAFEARGYAATVVAPYSEYFTVLVDRYYDVYDFSNGGIIPFSGTDEQILAEHHERTTMYNMFLLLVKRWALPAFRRVLYITGVGSKPLQQAYPELSDVLGPNVASKPQAVNFLNALNDALVHPLEGPSLNVLHYMLPHYPFVNGADGEANPGDINDIMSYKAHHQYAAKVLIRILDMILAKDPNAVIVLQADHGLHGQSESEITAAFGADAVRPIWNQVASALRVPESFRDGDEKYALANPLNISRYLVNAFVGKNYEYVQ